MSKQDDELKIKPCLRDWLTLLQTNHVKSIDEQIANIDTVERWIMTHYLAKAEVLRALPKKYTPAEKMANVDASADYREGFDNAIDAVIEALGLTSKGDSNVV